MVGYATSCSNAQIPLEPGYQRADAFGPGYNHAGEVKGYDPVKADVGTVKDLVGSAYKKAAVAGRDYLETLKENIMPKQLAPCYSCKH